MRSATRAWLREISLALSEEIARHPFLACAGLRAGGQRCRCEALTGSEDPALLRENRSPAHGIGRHSANAGRARYLAPRLRRHPQSVISALPWSAFSLAQRSRNGWSINHI